MISKECCLPIIALCVLCVGGNRLPVFVLVSDVIGAKIVILVFFIVFVIRVSVVKGS